MKPHVPPVPHAVDCGPIPYRFRHGRAGCVLVQGPDGYGQNWRRLRRVQVQGAIRTQAAPQAPHTHHSTDHAPHHCQPLHWPLLLHGPSRHHTCTAPLLWTHRRACTRPARCWCAHWGKPRTLQAVTWVACYCYCRVVSLVDRNGWRRHQDPSRGPSCPEPWGRPPRRDCGAAGLSHLRAGALRQAAQHGMQASTGTYLTGSGYRPAQDGAANEPAAVSVAFDYPALEELDPSLGRCPAAAMTARVVQCLLRVSVRLWRLRRRADTGAFCLPRAGLQLMAFKSSTSGRCRLSSDPERPSTSRQRCAAVAGQCAGTGLPTPPHA